MNLVPSLTKNQWLWLGGATALGVTEVVSAPIALALAALPVLDSLGSEQEKTPSRRAPNGRTRAPRRRRATPRRTARPRSASTTGTA